MQFSLVPDFRDVRVLMAVTLPGVILLVAFSWLVAALGRSSGGTALEFTIFAAIVVPALIVTISRARFGVLIIDSKGILLKRGLRGVARESYPWRDVISLSIGSGPGISLPGAAWLATLAGMPSNNRFVEVQLRRSTRLGMWPFRGGTSTPGIPIGVRTLRLPTPNPADVLTAARPFLDIKG